MYEVEGGNSIELTQSREKSGNPGLHMFAMIVSTIANMFPTLFQAILIHVNTLIAKSQAAVLTSQRNIVINCSVSSSCSDRNHHPGHVSSLVSSDMDNLNQGDMV